MGQKPNWTQGEYQVLQELWGTISIPAIAKRLGRSPNAVKIKANKLGLGPHLQGGVYVSFKQMLEAIGQDQNYSYIKKRLQREGFPFKRRKVEKCSFLMVDVNAFWKWMEQYKDLLNFAKFEEYALGPEPNWVVEKRHADILAAKKYKHTPWSKAEDERLVLLLNQYKYSYADISERMGRTEGAIKRRMRDLKLKQRPIKAISKLWTQAEVDKLIDLKKRGYGFEYIGEQLDRTASACRGRYERLQNPEYFVRANRREREKKMKGAPING